MNKETLSTSKEEVPKIKLGLQEKYDQEKKEEPHAKRLDPDNIKEMVNQLPTPVGYRLLVLQALEDKYQAQISEADATIKI